MIRKIFKIFDQKFINKDKVIIYLPNYKCFNDEYLLCDKEFQILENKVDELILLQKEIAANLLEMNRVKQAAAKKKKVKPKVAPKPKPNPLKFP